MAEKSFGRRLLLADLRLGSRVFAANGAAILNYATVVFCVPTYKNTIWELNNLRDGIGPQSATPRPRSTGVPMVQLIYTTNRPSFDGITEMHGFFLTEILCHFKITREV